MIDAYRALALLAEHPRIDRKRIAIMGFSKGAVAAVYSSVKRFRKMWGSSDIDFAAHIGFYPACNVTYRDDDKVAPVPIVSSTASPTTGTRSCPAALTSSG